LFINQDNMFQDNQPQTQQTGQQSAPVQPQQVQQQAQTAAPVAATAIPPVAAPVVVVPVAVPEQTTQEERMWAVIAYIAFLGIITLAVKPKSDFCKHHAANGLAIFMLWFVSLILLAMPSFIGAIGGLMLLSLTVVAVLGILKAIQSYKLELPVLSTVVKMIPTDSIIGSVTGKIPDAAQPTNQQGGSDGNQNPPQA